MGFWKNFFFKAPTDDYSSDDIDEYSSDDIEVIRSQALRIVDVINESLKIAKESNNPDTKLSRLWVAKTKLSELKKLAEQFPFLELKNLKEVEADIEELEKECSIAGLIEDPKKWFASYGELANGEWSAKTLEQEGKTEEAIIEYEKLVSKKADTPFTYQRLAILYRKAKNQSDEIRVIEEALRNIPKSNSKNYSWFKERLEKIKTKNA